MLSLRLNELTGRRRNGKLMPTGTIALALRRLNARTVPKMVSVPKELLV